MPARREPGSVRVEDRWYNSQKQPTKDHERGKRWRVRWVDYDRKEKTKAFERQVDAKKFATSITSEILRGEYIDRHVSATAVRSFYEPWYGSLTHLKDTTRFNYRGAWKNHVEPAWGDREIGTIKKTDVAGWVAAMVEDGKGPATIHIAHNVLYLVLEYAVDDRKLNSNPAHGVTLPAKSGKAHTYLTVRQVEGLARAVDELGADPLLVRVLGYCGLRWGEVAALRVADVDLGAARLRVRHNDTRPGGRLVETTPKNHEARAVPFPAVLAGGLEARTVGRRGDERVFRSPNGRPLAPDNYAKRVFAPAVKACRESDERFPRLTAHDLRHTAASLAVRSGANVKAVQRMLGHKSAAMTLDVYTDLFDNDLDDVAARMSALIEGA